MVNVAIIRPNKMVIQTLTIKRIINRFTASIAYKLVDSAILEDGPWTVVVSSPSAELQTLMKDRTLIGNDTPRLAMTRWALVNTRTDTRFHIIAATITRFGGMKSGYTGPTIKTFVPIATLTGVDDLEAWKDFVAAPLIKIGLDTEQIIRHLLNTQHNTVPETSRPTINVSETSQPAMYLAQAACDAAVARGENCSITLEPLASFGHLFVNTCGHVFGPDAANVGNCPTCRSRWNPTRVTRTAVN